MNASFQSSLLLRLLPSFHQHVEIRLTATEEGTAIWVWVQGEYIPPHPLPDRGPDFTEEALAPKECFAEAVAAFERSRTAEIDKEWRGIVLDGMSAECTLVANGQVVELNEHTWRPGMNEVLRTVVGIAWDNCKDLRVKNALAECAKYNGEIYPLLPIPPEPHRTHLMLIGDAEEKKALREVL